MWKLTNVHAENLCAFQNLDWEIPQGVTTLIFGDNMDNDSQRSNGSGKSALIEAIAIGLIGDPLRKAKIDDIINDNADECIVSLRLHNTDDNSVFEIERTFGRKAPQSIKTSLNGEPVVQSSVAEYNKYILEQFGLSKDDILSSFVLCQNKYVSFISSKDSDKKDLINRFSNGVMVDEAIEALQADIAPVKRELNEAENNVSFLTGKVEALTEQINTQTNEISDAKLRKKERIESIRQSIAAHREKIRVAKHQIECIDCDWADVEKLETEFKRIEDDNTSLEASYMRIVSIWKKDLLGPLEDSHRTIVVLQDSIEKIIKRQKSNASLIADYQKEVARLQKNVEDAQKAHEDAAQSADLKRQALTKQIDDWKKAIKEANIAIGNLTTSQNKAHQFISTLQAQLSGTIQCPKCGHKWIAQSEKSVEELADTLTRAKKRLEEINNDIDSNRTTTSTAQKNIQDANSQIIKLSDVMSAKSQAVMSATTGMNRVKNTLNEMIAENDRDASQLQVLQNRIKSARTEMFDKIFAAVDAAISRFDQETKRQENIISTEKGTIESLEESIKEIESSSPEDALVPLKKSLEEKQKELDKAITHRDEIDDELNRLSLQETRFNEFKTYLANSKIAALSQITNEFLEQIGSDIRISFSGFTILKSGKVRDKISISLMRDGIDCGAFGKFSGGERSRAELATILALQKLTNLSCPDGKGLDLLVLDEILEAVDEDGLAAIFEALNSLQMTSLVVSHGNIAENYPHKLIIHKKNSVSFINGNEA